MQYPQRAVEERKRQRITQLMLAEHLQTTQQMINKYEQSKVELPAYRLLAIAELLNVSIDWLLGRTDCKEVRKIPQAENSESFEKV